MNHFLTLRDLSAEALQQIVQRAIELKRSPHSAGSALQGRTLGMIFEKSSTRTRVSAEVAMAQMGGHAIFLSPRDTQLGRGEPLEDTARVLSRMVDAVFIRTDAHEKLQRFAEHSRVPVINALSDLFHPCQLLADMQTFHEQRGDIRGATVAWVGDGNNMCHSYIYAAQQFGFSLRLACPPGYGPDPEILQGAESVQVCDSPEAAVRNSDLVVTDVWASMGQESEQVAREKAFAGYQVDEDLMALS
ncbi:MAG: ornithine carbamoyltransferase, partial [Gammaproteobacteria bacterium]